jgi:hypothetical protein
MTQNSSIVLDLEYLNTKYNNLLIEYKQAMLDYTNYLKNETSDTNIQMVSIKGQTYWGTSGLIASESNTVQECEAYCMSTKGCTGATFSSSESLCSLRTGDSPLSIGTSKDYAIIPKEKQLLLSIENINTQLTEINSQIQQKNSLGKNIYDKEAEKRFMKNEILINQYDQLLEEKNKIKSMIHDYDTLNASQEEGSLTTNKNYYGYLLLGLLALFTIFILLKLTTSEVNGNLNINTFLFILVIIIFIFGFNIYKNLFVTIYNYIINLYVIKNFLSWSNNLYNTSITSM